MSVVAQRMYEESMEKKGFSFSKLVWKEIIFFKLVDLFEVSTVKRKITFKLESFCMENNNVSQVFN